MSSAACKDVHGFADGELAAADAQGFRDHLQGCGACRHQMDFIFALKGLAETAPEFGLIRRARPVRGRVALWWGGIGFGALAAAAALVLHFRTPPASVDPIAWNLPPARSLEMRLAYAPVDHYRPLALMRGTAGSASVASSTRSLESLAAMEARGDRRGLLAHWLLDGDLRQAQALLAQLPEDSSFDNERAVLALLQAQPDQALTFLDRSSADEKTAPIQALWNRGLALRGLGLPLSAGSTFESVGNRQEPGWAAEARSRAQQLRDDVEGRRDRWAQVSRQLHALAVDRVSPQPETIRRFPEPVREAFYDAVRGAPGGSHLAALMPLAKVLDAHFGGGTLVTYVERIQRRPWSRRSDLAHAYAAQVAKADPISRRWSSPRDPEIKDLEDKIRRAGESDLLVGLLIGTRTEFDRVDDFVRAADISDPWFNLHTVEAKIFGPHSMPVDKQELAFRSAISRAEAARLPGWNGRLQAGLVDVLNREGRVREAWRLGMEILSSARARGDWPREVAQLRQLARLSHQRGHSALLRAYGGELLLADNACHNQRLVNQLRAERAMLEHRDDEARALATTVLPQCDKGGMRTAGIHVLSELASRDKEGPLRYAFEGALAEARRNVPATGGGERSFLSALEGRAFIDRDPDRWRKSLEDVITEVDRSPTRDAAAQNARFFSYLGLIRDASRRADEASVLRLVAAERRAPSPKGCVLALAQDHDWLMVAARGSGGRLLGTQRSRSGGWGGVSGQIVVEPPIRTMLSDCSEVAVMAMAPYHGRADLLPAAIPWRHHEAEAPPADSYGTLPMPLARRLVISDVTAPSALDLPPLQLWHGRRGPAPSRHLRGAEANPQEVLQALPDADLIEFHVHGLVDLKVADASFLALSPDSTGAFALTAGQIQAQRLSRKPVVVLAACDSAASDSFRDAPGVAARWSLPAAFLSAGARAVFAATQALPDQQASDFFDDVITSMATGASPAVALRDARVRWLQKGATWVQSVVLFQ